MAVCRNGLNTRLCTTRSTPWRTPARVQRVRGRYHFQRPRHQHRAVHHQALTQSSREGTIMRFMADPPTRRSTPDYHAHVAVRELPSLDVITIAHPDEAERIAAQLNHQLGG